VGVENSRVIKPTFSNVFENRDLKKEMKKGEKALKLKTLVTLLLEEIEQF
jgi:mRNA-degrading endonuclease YafQ of YafQ-DinJ toxin-antitoxin module